MPFTESELYVLRDFNTLGDDEAYQIAFRLLESELLTLATFSIPAEYVLTRHEWPEAPAATLLFDLYCCGFYYAIQIIGEHLVRVSKIDLTARREHITWRNKKRMSHDYPFPPVVSTFSD